MSKFGSRVARKLLRKIVRWIGVGLILGINLLLLFRVFTAGDPRSVRPLLADPATVAAYEAAEAAGRELPVKYQRFETVTSQTGQYSYFTVTSAHFLPTAGQAQLVFRYSNAMLEWLAEDYALPEKPGRHEELFEVTLLVEKTDGSTQRYYPEAEALEDTKFRYNYRKLCFNGLDCFAGEDFSEEVERVQVCIYYLKDIDYERAPYGELSIYQKGIRTRDYELTRQDRKALEAAP